MSSTTNNSLVLLPICSLYTYNAILLDTTTAANVGLQKGHHGFLSAPFPEPFTRRKAEIIRNTMPTNTTTALMSMATPPCSTLSAKGKKQLSHVCQMAQEPQRRQYDSLQNKDSPASTLDLPEEPAEEDDPYQPKFFDKVREIGCSTEGIVDLMRHRPTGQLQVFKRSFPNNMNRKGKKVYANLFDEADIVIGLMDAAERCHENIIKIFFAERIRDGPRMTSTVLCLEYCAGGDLWQQLRRFEDLGVKTPVPFTLQCLIGIGEALAFLHRGLMPTETPGRYETYDIGLPIIHQDIKPGNILLRFPCDSFGMPVPVLADFGQATTEPFFPCGTKGYHSPEQLEPEKFGRHGTPSDVYTYAQVIYELCCEGRKHNRWMSGANTNNLKLRGEYQQLGVEHFLQRCLAIDPKDRLVMSSDSGLLYIQMFRVLRENMAKTADINPEVWSTAREEDEGHGVDMNGEANNATMGSDEDAVWDGRRRQRRRQRVCLSVGDEE